MTDNQKVQYDVLDRELSHQQIGVTAAEVHGLLSGLICGGSQSGNWQRLVQELIHDGESFNAPLDKQIAQLYEYTEKQLNRDDFGFRLLIGEDSFDSQAEALSGWVNHFLLGLMMQYTKFEQVSNELTEIIRDLQEIAQLGYDEEDDPDELERDFEHVVEYVRVAVMLCYSELHSPHQPMPKNPVLH